MFWVLTPWRQTLQICPKWSCLFPLILQGIRVLSRQSPANCTHPAQPVKKSNPTFAETEQRHPSDRTPETGMGQSPGCFFQGFVLQDSFSAVPTKARLLESCGGPIPPAIYSVRFSPHHDSDFDLPAPRREAQRSIRLSRDHGPPLHYSGYRACEPAASPHGPGAASRRDAPPADELRPP